ncbi:MAG: LuxR C-terminal-related transcriptional regulator [Desulfovibrionaceae bacterium]|nr:LuxR C-terminal-related transcriptional regulator [Desulfovibrionaceae bacterium]
MGNEWKRKKGQSELASDLGISTCIYPPQATKSGLPEYAADSLPSAPVAAQGGPVASRPVLPFDFSLAADWQALLESALGSGQQPFQKHSLQDAEEENKLEALLQAIVEHGQEMLPLLRLLREKAETDNRLAELVDLLQSRLNLSISAACSLAPREMEVLERAASGESNPQIAHSLNLQTITVAKALSRAYRKLGARNRTDAVHKWLLLRGRRS